MIEGIGCGVKNIVAQFAAQNVPVNHWQLAEKFDSCREIENATGSATVPEIALVAQHRQ
jgi:hypothetical protein